jgi:hypothetical protein
VLQNVLAFDSFDAELLDMLVEVFQKHGLPAGEAAVSGRGEVGRAVSRPLPHK